MEKKTFQSPSSLDTLDSSGKHGLSPGLLTLIIIVVFFISSILLFIIVWRSFGINFLSLSVWLNVATTFTIFFLLGITIGLSIRNYFLTQIREFLIFGSMLSLPLIIGLGNVILTVIMMDYNLKTYHPDIQYIGLDLLQFCWPELIFPFFSLRSTGLRSSSFWVVPFNGEYVALSWSTFGNPVIALVTLMWDCFTVISNFIILFIFSLYFARAIWHSTPRRIKVGLYSLTGANLLFILVGFILDLMHFIDRTIHDPYVTIPMENHLTSLGIDFWIPTDFPLLILIPLAYDIIVFPSVVIYSCFYLGIRMYRVIDPSNPTTRIYRSSYLWKTAIIFLMIFEFMNVVVNLPFVLINWLEELNIISHFGIGGTIPPIS